MKYILLAVFLTFSVQASAECTNWAQKFHMTIIKGHAMGMSEREMARSIMESGANSIVKKNLVESLGRVYPGVVEADLDMEQARDFEEMICPSGD